MDFYVVLIADTPNLNNFHLEFSCQLKSLGTGQLHSSFGRPKFVRLWRI
jgi:hypothetical protein